MTYTPQQIQKHRDSAIVTICVSALIGAVVALITTHSTQPDVTYTFALMGVGGVVGVGVTLYRAYRAIRSGR